MHNLINHRNLVYKQSNYKLNCESLNKSQIIEKLKLFMKIKSLKVNTKQKKYSIYFNNNLTNEINKILNKEKLKFEKCLIVYDSKIKKNFVEKILKKIHSPKKYNLKLISSETNKNFNNVNLVIKYLLKEKFSRNDCVISLGGVL